MEASKGVKTASVVIIVLIFLAIFYLIGYVCFQEKDVDELAKKPVAELR